LNCACIFSFKSFHLLHSTPSHMSLLPKESIKVLAEAAGVTSLNDETAAALASDVEYRMREIMQEAIKFMRRSKREMLTTDDVNSALRLRNVEALYGFSSIEPLKFRRLAGTNDLVYIADQELDFQSILNAPLPKCPRDVSLTAHWLAIDGIQPAIPQNPSPGDLAPTNKKTRMISPSDSTISSDTPIEVIPIVKHVLSKEMQLYYEKIIAAIRGKEEEIFEAALNSLRSDPSLHQLLPYFTQFVHDEVTHNLRNLRLLVHIMKMVKAILDSKYLHVEPYLHQLMPPILTCLVGKTLCENPSDNHWELRDFSAELVAKICNKFGDVYANLQSRITKTLTHALQDVTKPLTTHYGAIVGISSLGYRSVELLLLPYVAEYMKLLAPEQQSDNQIKKLEAQRCYQAMLNAVGIFLSKVSTEERQSLDVLQQVYEELFSIFGESLLPFVTQNQEDKADPMLI